MQNQLFELAYAAVVAWRTDDLPTYNAAMLRLAAEVDQLADDGPAEGAEPEHEAA